MTPELTKLMEENLKVLRETLPLSNQARVIHGDSINKIIEDSWVAGFTAAVKAMEEKQSGLLADARELQKACLEMKYQDVRSGNILEKSEVYPFDLVLKALKTFTKKYGSGE